jgi:transcriptional regulator with XRE-family HTH domain
MSRPQRLVELRKERGITQTDLADLIGSTQRAISHYETVAEFPPANVIVDLARALGVSTDQLLGLKPTKKTLPTDDPDVRRLWKKFQRVLDLPEKDQRAVLRLVSSLHGLAQR